MELEIREGAALDDAYQIEEIVKTIQKDMQELDSVFKKTEEGLQLDWAETVRANWKNYLNTDIPEAMAEMTLSAQNLKRAVEASTGYSREQ